MKKVKYKSTDESQVKWGGNDNPKDTLEIDCIYDVKSIEAHS